MEPNRIWHEPVVEVFGNAISPGVRCTARAFDMGNRRWYHLKVDSVVNDWDWLASVVAKHVREHHEAHGVLPSWNTISTTKEATPVTYEVTSYDRIARTFTEDFPYGHRPSDRLPTVHFDEIYDKVYLYVRIDACRWKNQNCALKRVEFDCDFETYEREIRVREAVLERIETDSEPAVDGNLEMARRFNLIAILAVVLDKSPVHPGESTMVGLLMPYAGQSLELIDQAAPELGLPVTEAQLCDLACGVQQLALCGFLHGDINDRNVVFDPEQQDRVEGRAGRLMLIDLGDIAPGYETDAKALADLFLWSLERSPALNADLATKERVEKAAAFLKDEDFDRAIETLSPSSARKPRSGYDSSSSEDTRSIETNLEHDHIEMEGSPPDETYLDSVRSKYLESNAARANASLQGQSSK